MSTQTKSLFPTLGKSARALVFTAIVGLWKAQSNGQQQRAVSIFAATT